MPHTRIWEYPHPHLTRQRNMQLSILSVLAISAIPLMWALPKHLPTHFGSSDISQGEERASQSQDIKGLDFHGTIGLAKRKDTGYQPVHTEPIPDLDEDGNFTVIIPSERPHSAPFMSLLCNMKSLEDEEEDTEVNEVAKELMEMAGIQCPV
jgi:hypothetical protein